MARLTTEDTIFRNISRPQETQRPPYHSVPMMRPSGVVTYVVTATASYAHDGVEPESNPYGQKHLREKMALGWLRMDMCPLSTGQGGPLYAGQMPCKNGESCKHLREIQAKRLAEWDAHERKYAENWSREEEKKAAQQAQADMVGQAVSDALGKSGGQQTSDVTMLQMQLMELQKQLAEMAADKKPSKRSKKTPVEEIE